MLRNLTAHLLDDLVVGQRNPLLVELAITSFVDQLPHTLQVRVPTNSDSIHLDTNRTSDS